MVGDEAEEESKCHVGKDLDAMLQAWSLFYRQCQVLHPLISLRTVSILQPIVLTHHHNQLVKATMDHSSSSAMIVGNQSPSISAPLRSG